MSYRTSHIHPYKGKTYHALFNQSPYRRMVWQFEKQVLDDILKEFFKEIKIDHLDFACGTGRILSYLEDRTTTSTGVDLSPSMLKVARENVICSEIVLGDITREQLLKDCQYDLITAFRFFPNAENELQYQAMHALTKRLKTNGYLVFNNHKHIGSTRNRLAKLLGRRNFKGMSLSEVKKLTQQFNLEIVKIYSLCIFPASEKRTLLPIFLLHPIEIFLRKFFFLNKYGENLIFVCRHTEPTAQLRNTI